MSVYAHKEFDDHQKIAFFNDMQSAGIEANLVIYNTLFKAGVGPFAWGSPKFRNDTNTTKNEHLQQQQQQQQEQYLIF